MALSKAMLVQVPTISGESILSVGAVISAGGQIATVILYRRAVLQAFSGKWLEHSCCWTYVGTIERPVCWWHVVAVPQIHLHPSLGAVQVFKHKYLNVLLWGSTAIDAMYIISTQNRRHHRCHPPRARHHPALKTHPSNQLCRTYPRRRPFRSFHWLQNWRPIHNWASSPRRWRSPAICSDGSAPRRETRSSGKSAPAKIRQLRLPPGQASRRVVRISWWTYALNPAHRRDPDTMGDAAMCWVEGIRPPQLEKIDTDGTLSKRGKKNSLRMVCRSIG